MFVSVLPVMSSCVQYEFCILAFERECGVMLDLGICMNVRAML